MGEIPRRNVAVGLSGGVDSAVAAYLLMRQGYEVAGATMRIWAGSAPATGRAGHACYGPGEEQDIADSRRVAEQLGIPFHVVDLAKEYRARVLDPCRRAYCSGTTPNPCVHCNATVKFELIPAELRRRGLAVDYFATGHYARVTYDAGRSRHLLQRARDAHKDQSYFLYLLTQAQLGTTLFPLGDHHKDEVRRLAAEMSLPVAAKPESQDFISGGYHSLFDTESVPGPILDEAGHVLGRHGGIRHYTVGQRRGLRISGGRPLYVTAIDAPSNAVQVGPAEGLLARELVAHSLNWIAIERLDEPLRVKARIRYRHRESDAVVSPMADGRVHVRFDQAQPAIAPGQAVVFYQGDTVVGGGTIEGRV